MPSSRLEMLPEVEPLALTFSLMKQFFDARLLPLPIDVWSWLMLVHRRSRGTASSLIHHFLYFMILFMCPLALIILLFRVE